MKALIYLQHPLAIVLSWLLASHVAVAEVSHKLGNIANARFDFQTAISHECPNFSIKHGSRPFSSVDFNLDGVPDPFVFYNCVRRGEELVHPYYYVGPDVNVLVMLSQPDGTFINGNMATFGQERATAGYFGFVGFELRDHAYDLNGDGYKDFVYHVWRDGQWQADCYTRASEQDTERCNDENPDWLPEARWTALYNQDGRYQYAPGGGFATRGILLSKGNGSYEAKIIATGQDTEPGGGVSVFQDSEGYWTIWITGPYFGAGAYRDQIEEDWLPAPNSGEPLEDGNAIPTPGPKVYRFEDGVMLDVTSEYFLISTKGTGALGSYCEYEKAVAERLAAEIEAAGFDPDDCRVWVDPRFGNNLQDGIEYLPLSDNPSAVVTWSHTTNRSFLTRICFEQQGQVCSALDDLDASFGQRFSVPILRVWRLQKGYGWVEQWSATPENSMTVIPTPNGIFWRIYNQSQWGYSLMDRPNGFLEKFKLAPDSPYEYVVYTCCRNATYLDPGIEPESLGVLALENWGQKFFQQEAWTPENCPSFLWGVEPSHCNEPYAWRHMTPSVVFEGAPSDLYSIWLEGECGGVEDGSEAFTNCLEDSGGGLLDYRYDALKAGFDHISFAFDERGKIQRKNFDPVEGLARNASNYQIEMADLNGDGLHDFIAGTHPWFNEWFSPEQRQGYNHPRLTIGLNNGAFGFEEATTYWPELIGMNKYEAGRAPQEQLAQRLVAYYFGNWYRDFNNDGVADLMLFDRAQDSLALGGLPEVSISHAIITPDLSAPAAPVIASTQFDDGALRVSLVGPEAPNGGSSEGEVTYVLVCTDGVGRYQTTSPSGPLILSGLDDEATFQCSVRAQSATGSFSQASFTTDAIVSETAGVEGGLPIWLLYEASQSG
jgi:hypothetical protein